MSSLDDSSPQTSTHTTTKPQRTLACTSCQNRKVKCDRKFPCSSCIKSNVQCIPVAAPRQRRRRFPEAELLQRVRYLEDLLRQHDIEFEPLHGNATEKSENKSGREGKRKGSPEIKTETTFEAKYLHLLSRITESNFTDVLSKKSVASYESKSATSSPSFLDGRRSNNHRPVSFKQSLRRRPSRQR